MPYPYKKRFIPLESNPEVFTRLMHRLGVSKKLQFQDIYSIDEPDQLQLPALALVFIFPDSETHRARIVREDAARNENVASDDQNVMWFEQTIHNACGFYALLHSVCNGPAKSFIEPGTLMDKIVNECQPLGTQDRALVLERSEELEKIYGEAAADGETEVPGIEDEVESHYICFVKSNVDSHLYELDGDRKGPVDKGLVKSNDMLSREGLDAVKKYLQDGGIGFGLMALVKTE